MTRTELIDGLCGYRELCTRIEMLEYRIEKAERQYSIAGPDAIAGAQLKMRPLTGMPTGMGGISSPTERTALDVMSFSDEGKKLEVETELRELEKLLDKKRQLDIMLGCLREKERFVIMAHLVDGLRWKETERRFEAEYGIGLTERGLKYIMGNGIERMQRTMV